MEELLRQAFRLGQQWIQDMNNDKEPTNFNEWYASKEVQEQVKNCSIPDVGGSFLYELKTIAYGKGSSSERLEEIKEKLSSK